jgi:hypothetical protein
MSEWVLHCAVDQRHIRRSQPTREAALKDACAQLLQGHAVNRIVGPNETITADRVRDWCAEHRASSKTQSPNSHHPAAANGRRSRLHQPQEPLERLRISREEPS